MADVTEQDGTSELDRALAGKHSFATTKEAAMMTVLLAAVYADGTEHDNEVAEFDQLVSRINTFKAVSEEQRRKLRQESQTLVRGTETARNDHAKLAAESLVMIQNGDPTRNMPPQPGLAKAAFAHACDLVFSDMKVTDEERTFLRVISEALALDRKDAERIVKLIGLKNDY